jgi:hypothetical protein
MANRREEERERLRQARQERETQQTGSEKRRLFVAYLAAGAIGLAVVIGIVIVASSGGGSSGSAHINQASGSTNGVTPDERSGTEVAAVQVKNLTQAAKRAGCVVRLELKDEGKGHLSPTASAPDYGTNPPTSGDHAESPYQQADGAYDEVPAEIFVLHALEHGRVAIQYSPNLPENEQLELKGLHETMYGGTLLFPNDQMPYAVAATAWTNLLGCKEYKGAITLDAIRAFGKRTWGRYGGEGAGAVNGPTPLKPTS